MSNIEAVSSKKNSENHQIVSKEITNGCIVDDTKTVNSQSLTNDKSVSDNNINKDFQIDVCMEPLLIQDCVNTINKTSVTYDLLNDANDSLNVCDIIENNNGIQENSKTIVNCSEEFLKDKLSLNLKESSDLNDKQDLVNTSKHKKFLESDDQIMNQIFFQTITITPTTDEDILILNDKVLKDDNVALDFSETNSDLNIEAVNFFSSKIDEDDPFDPNYIDSVESEGDNLCSLKENYCSFSSIDYNTANIQLIQENQLSENETIQTETLICEYADKMLKQRPSIVVDCYDSDSKTEEKVVIPTDEKIDDFCFYFDQTIEEDDGDINFSSDNAQNETSNFVNIKEIGKDEYSEDENDSRNDESDDADLSDIEDAGVLNESCLSVNSAIENFESESKIVKKTVKKSIKTSKTTSKKSSKTISTAETSSLITSSDIENHNNSNEKKIKKINHDNINLLDQTLIQPKSDTTNLSTKQELSDKIIQESNIEQQVEIDINDAEKKKSNKKKTKKKKSDSTKENISVNTSTSIQTMSIVSQSSKKNSSIPAKDSPTLNYQLNNFSIISNKKTNSFIISNNHQKHVISSSYQLYEDDLSKIDVKSLKEKYSNAIQKHSMKFSSSTGANSIGFLSFRKDMSVKNLCRSFGDLSTLNNDDKNNNYFQHVYRTKSVCDLRKLENVPIYTGVSVRNLRTSYCSLVGLTDITQKHYSESLQDSKYFKHSIKNMCKGKLIKLGIKQFDMKSSFSKFDALQKKNMQLLQNGKSCENGLSPDGEKKCHACEKVVFQMEQIKAEKKFWHRSCFRCAECSKQLNVDTYQSHEGILYCKQHFKTLFSPKVVEDNNEPVKIRKNEMIILENQPVELPPDVIRSSDKADLGLDELHQINLRQRFQLFENAGQQDSKIELDRANNVKRSTSILSKLARFQAKGMDVGVVDDSLNGISYENSSSEEEVDEEELDDENHEDIELIRAKRAQKEKPMSFKEMHDIKSKFESGQLMSKEERREERKQELQNIRSRLFMGKQAKIKEMYQQAVAESEQTITSSNKKSDVEIGDKAKSIKEKFEKGEIYDENDMKKTLQEDELAVFEKGLGKQSRSLFLELDATASKSPNQESSPSANLKLTSRQTPRKNSHSKILGEDVVRSDQKLDDVQIETADIVSKFKFFETYQPPEKEKKSFRITPPRDYQGLTKLTSPEKEVYRDPHIARNDKRTTDQDEILELQKTASKVLSMFRQMEENKEEKPNGLKPLKRFTPPPESERGRFETNDDSEPDYSEDEDEECSEEESETEINYVKSSQKDLDEFLKAAQSAERAKKLREKFEKWEENEIKKEMNNSSINLYDEAQDEGQMETAKSLKARFEQMQNEEPKLPSNRPKVNRFV